jgi:hypothetical protein
MVYPPVMKGVVLSFTVQFSVFPPWDLGIMLQLSVPPKWPSLADNPPPMVHTIGVRGLPPLPPSSSSLPAGFGGGMGL